MNRLPISMFDIPTAEIRRGYRSATYFNRAKSILQNYPEAGRDTVMQVFQRRNAVLCGMDEALAHIILCTGHWTHEDKATKRFDSYMEAKLKARQNPHDAAAAHAVVVERVILDEMWVNTYDQIEVEALFDGDEIAPWNPVMYIKGDLEHFVHLESVYLGILARRTKVATNTRAVVEAAHGKPVMFFADRFDHYGTQGGDGYAAFVGGASGVASDAMADWWGAYGLGTMPHALIAAFNGNTVAAAEAFSKIYPDVDLIALVDFHNNCVREALACAEAFGDKLWGVRLDTSGNMVDESIIPYMGGDLKPTGVNKLLVENVRNALDQAGHPNTKILVSGGFNPERIAEFEREGVPVDAYAVGSSLLAGSFDYTADIASPVTKVGRSYDPTWRLSKVVST